MQINVKKDNEDIVLSLVINQKEEPFDYVKLVNELYNKNINITVITNGDIESDLIEDGNFTSTTLSLVATLRANHPHSEDTNV